MAPNIKYWDDWVDVEDMEAMWNRPEVCKEWLQAGEERGSKVRMSRNFDGKPYVTQTEMKGMAEIITCRYFKGLDVGMICAIAEVESSRQPLACRFEPKLGEVCIGLMQTLPSTAEWLETNMGYGAYAIEGVSALLYRPFVSVYFGAAYLKWLSTYDGKKRNEEFMVRGYNSGPQSATYRSTVAYWNEYLQAKQSLPNVSSTSSVKKAVIPRKSTEPKASVVATRSRKVKPVHINQIDRNFLDSQLARVLALFEEACRLAVKGKPHDEGPWLVCSNVSPILFETWIESQEKRWKLVYKDGDVRFYGDPSILHEMMSGWFPGEILVGLQHIDSGWRAFRFGSSPRYEITMGMKEPDFFFVHMMHTSRPAPLVGEIAYCNESMPTLLREVAAWVDGLRGAQMCIGVKLARPRTPHQRQPLITVVTQMRGQASPTLVEIGRGSLCLQPGLPNYIIQIPLDLLYDGLPLSSGLQPGLSIGLDLFYLRQLVLHEFH